MRRAVRSVVVALSALVATACPGPSPEPITPTLPPPGAPPPPATGTPAPAPKPSPPAAETPDPEPWRAKQPASGAPVKFTPPKIERVALKNGIPVYVVENHGLPLVVVQVLVKAGAGANPQGKEGLASFTANLMDEGAGKLSALQIADRKDSLGATLVVDADVDESAATVDSLADKLGPSLDLLADVVLRPRFEQAEIDRVKSDVVNEIKRMKDSGPLTASNVLDMIVYGPNHPYAYPLLGTEASVSSLTRDDLAGFHAAYWHPGNAALIVAGDITPKEAVAALEKRFGAWKAGPQAKKAPQVPPAPDHPMRRIYVVDRPRAEQGDVLVGFPGLSRLDEDWIAVEVMNRILGGMFSSRINMNLREGKGATYGARSRFSSTLGQGRFSAGGAMVLDRTTLAVSELVKELEGMTSRPASEAELRRAKDAATLGLAARFETNGAIADAVGEVVVYDLPLDYYTQYVQMVQAVGPEAVTEAARKWLKPGRAAIVVVGPVDKLRKELAGTKLGSIEKRGPYGEPL
jgi:zinc protease